MSNSRITPFLTYTGRAEEEIDRLFARLSEDGQVFMPLNAYPFSATFAWIADQFGVSWQLSLEEQECGLRFIFAWLGPT